MALRGAGTLATARASKTVETLWSPTRIATKNASSGNPRIAAAPARSPPELAVQQALRRCIGAEISTSLPSRPSTATPAVPDVEALDSTHANLRAQPTFGCRTTLGRVPPQVCVQIFLLGLSLQTPPGHATAEVKIQSDQLVQPRVHVVLGRARQQMIPPKLRAVTIPCTNTR